MSAELSARSVSETDQVDKVRAFHACCIAAPSRILPGASTPSTTRSPAATSCGGHGPKWHPTRAPSPISPLLANIVLHVIDEAWATTADLGTLVRYADDLSCSPPAELGPKKPDVGSRRR
jgi:hypothetical protein